MAEIKIKRSKVKNNYLPKLPTTSQISEGELAMNYAKGAETLSFRNESGDIVTISADVEVETLNSAPTESTIFRSNGKPYKIGDEVRVTDSDTGSTSGYKFYKLYNITDSGTVAVWDVSAGGHSEVREQVNITITSNQAQPDNNLNGATVTVTDTTNNTNVITETWQGDTITAYVNALSAYKIEVSEVEGYTTPQSQSYTAQIGTERDVNFYYNCCKLTVNIDGINGQSSTVKYGSVSKTVADGGSINVPYGSSITISCNSVNGYAKPSDVTFTANTASKTVTMTYVASALKVNINSNQSNDTAITSLKATVKYGSTTVEASSGQTISVPTDQQVTVTFPTVTGYKTPSSFSFTNTNGGLVESSVTYQTEVVTVNVTASGGDSATTVGQKISVNGNVFTLDTSGKVVTKVPFGTTYSVSANTKSMYSTPATSSFTANQVSRTINMEYKYQPLGVYIQATDGSLYTSTEWASANKTANAIAVLTSNVKVLLALTQNSSYMRISSSYTDPLENYTTGITNSSVAKVDYNGQTNTTNIMKMQSSTSYAAGWCNSFTFPDGKTKGYLPSLGEWWEMYNNKSAIDTALSACGGTALKTDDYYWSSTYWGVDSYSNRRCWILRWSYGGVGDGYLSFDSYVRAAAAYPA